MTPPEFVGFRKIPRYSRPIVITEKIDGTNAQVYIGEAGEFFVASRSQWITPEKDNHGFAKWAYEHKDELMTLGPGRHFGEWWGAGIQRKYGLKEKRFSLFNTSLPEIPSCCSKVPVLYTGEFCGAAINYCLQNLVAMGSVAAPGFMEPEGIVIFHTAGNLYFKKTLEKDEEPKSAYVRIPVSHV